MNVLASEYSSGCESGWTHYLDQSYVSPNGFGQGSGFCEQDYKSKQLLGNQEDDDGEEEEDLSMVSDASSGPPHFHEDHSYEHAVKNPCGKRQQMKEQRRRRRSHKDHQELPSSFLDDTASSPVFNYKNNQASMESVSDFSQGFSSNFEGRSAYQDHYCFLQPSGSGNQLPNDKWFEEKRMGMR